jgi:hypothetical protein
VKEIHENRTDNFFLVLLLINLAHIFSFFAKITIQLSTITIPSHAYYFSPDGRGG